MAGGKEVFSGVVTLENPEGTKERAEKEQGAGRGASRRKMRHEHRCWSRKIRKKVSAKWAGNLQPFLSCMS